MLRHGRSIVWIIFALLASGLAARTFKVATVTPDNSPWTQTLKQFAQDIAQQTSSRVRFKIYAGGVAGEESDVLRKMKIGQIDAAILSALGASQVAPASLVMSLPLLIDNTDQLNRVFGQADTLFNPQGTERGYEILGWAFSGWVYLFSKKRIEKLEDLAKINLAIASNQTEMVAGWQALKATPRPLAFFDTPTGLQNGLVDTFYNTPTGAVAFQLFALAKNMTDIRLAPLTGAVVFSTRKWELINKGDQQLIRQRLQKVIEDFKQQSIELDRRATEIMLQNGLKVIEVDDAEKQRWREAFASLTYPFVVGEDRLVSPQVYQKVIELISAE